MRRTREMVGGGFRMGIWSKMRVVFSMLFISCRTCSFPTIILFVPPIPRCTARSNQTRFRILPSPAYRPCSEILENTRLDLLKLLRQFGPHSLLHLLILQQRRAPRRTRSARFFHQRLSSQKLTPQSHNRPKTARASPLPPRRR